MSFSNSVEKLVEHGRFNYGHYQERIKQLNPLEADFFRSFTPEFFKQSRLKEWQIFNISSSNFTGMLLLVDLKYVQLIHVSLYDVTKKRFYRKTVKKSPMSFDLLQSLSGGHLFYSEESLFVEIFTSEGLTPVKINMSFISETDQIPIKLMLEGSQLETKPFVYCKPIQTEKAVYSHRELMPIKGSLMISSVLYPIEYSDSQIIIEDYKSFQPFEMNSSWICAGSQSESLALSLSMNPYSKESDVLENVLWYKNETYPIGNINIEFAPNGWIITSDEGILDLVFVPKTLNRLSENYFMVKADGDFPTGELSGTINLMGEMIELNAVQAVGGNLVMKL